MQHPSLFSERAGTPHAVYWILAVGLFSFSFSPILVRFAGDTPALTLVIWRNLFSVVFLLPFLGAGRTAFRALSLPDLGRIAIAGMLLGAHFYLFFAAIQLTTVSSATVFVSLTPIFLAVFGFVFLNEKLAGIVWVGIGFSMVGGFMIAVGDAGAHGAGINPVMGNLLAISACLIVSIYLIIGRVVRQRLSWLTYVLPLYIASTVTVIILALGSDTPVFDLDAKIYGLCVLMAIGPQLLGHGSFNYALKYMPAAILGLLSLTEPVGSTILAYMLFEEVPSTLSLLGMIVTLGAVVLALTPGLLRKKKNNNSSVY